MSAQLTATLLRDIRDEVIQLLFNRYVFRTHQEIARVNPRLQGRPNSIFSEWAQINYAVTNAVGVRRLASQSYQGGDVNLVRLLDMFIRDPRRLWPGSAIAACKRVLGEDRRVVINAAEKANRFASKRAAHSVPDAPVNTTFSDLDDAIEAVKHVTEKYTLLVLVERRQEVEHVHRAGAPTVYPVVAQMEMNVDLLDEMKRRKLPKGWDAIFLEPWATPETIARPLGETLPPRRRATGS